MDAYHKKAAVVLERIGRAKIFRGSGLNILEGKLFHIPFLYAFDMI